MILLLEPAAQLVLVDSLRELQAAPGGVLLKAGLEELLFIACAHYVKPARDEYQEGDEGRRRVDGLLAGTARHS